MNSAPNEKDKIRKKLLNLRDSATSKQRNKWSDAITRRLLKLDKIIKAKSIFCYLSMGSEVRTFELIEALLEKDKLVAVPKITNYSAGSMEAHYIASLKMLKKNKLGALEPENDKIMRHADSSFDVVLAPGVGFSEDKNRIGMGAGFYDRYLDKYNPKIIIGLGFDIQIVKQLPKQNHDIKMDMVVTESKII